MRNTIPNLAELSADNGNGKYGFGIKPEHAAAALRLLADEIESGDVLPQEMKDFAKAAVGDYVFRTVTFSFATKLASSD